MRDGYELVYVDEVMGKGLTPADFTAYKSAALSLGVRRDADHEGALELDDQEGSARRSGQRFHFLTGWFAGSPMRCT